MYLEILMILSPLVNLKISLETRLSTRSQLNCLLEFCLIWKDLSSDGEGDDSVDFLQDEILTNVPPRRKN